MPAMGLLGSEASEILGPTNGSMAPWITGELMISRVLGCGRHLSVSRLAYLAIGFVNCPQQLAEARGLVDRVSAVEVGTEQSQLLTRHERDRNDLLGRLTELDHRRQNGQD